MLSMPASTASAQLTDCRWPVTLACCLCAWSTIASRTGLVMCVLTLEPPKPLCRPVPHRGPRLLWLAQRDLTEEAASRTVEVRGW